MFGIGLVRPGTARDVLSRHGLLQSADGHVVAPDHAHQLVDDVLERRGLGEVRRGAEVEGPHRERLLVEPAEHDDTGARGALQHQREGLQSVHPGHGGVEQHGVGLEATGEVHGVGAVGTLALHNRGAGQPELLRTRVRTSAESSTITTRTVPVVSEARRRGAGFPVNDQAPG